MCRLTGHFSGSHVTKRFRAGGSRSLEHYQRCCKPKSLQIHSTSGIGNLEAILRNPAFEVQK
jgi:hypothetical protein